MDLQNCVTQPDTFVTAEQRDSVYAWMAHFLDFSSVGPSEFPATIPFLSSQMANQIFRYRKQGFDTSACLVALLFGCCGRNAGVSVICHLPIYVVQDIARVLRDVNEECAWTPSGFVNKFSRSIKIRECGDERA